jgi:hypothetical protein
MHRNKSAEEIAEWERQVRLGALQSFTFFRTRLYRLRDEGRPLTSDELAGLIDLLDYTEQHLVDMWDLTRRVTQGDA